MFLRLVSRAVWVAVLVLALAITAVKVMEHQEAVQHPETVFLSPTECQNQHAVYRILVKNDDELPPDHIPLDHKIRPSDMAAWPVPKGKFTQKTPRSGKEKEWWELTGRVVLAKAEEDGDIHLQLEDADGKGKVQVVVEVPVGQPWDEIRTEIFSWTTAKFPFKTASSHPLTLKVKPLVRVEGMAFLDAMHAVKDGPPNRRKDGITCVFELHPIMTLEILKENP
jgi:hypothetical protein